MRCCEWHVLSGRILMIQVFHCNFSVVTLYELSAVWAIKLRYFGQRHSNTAMLSVFFPMLTTYSNES